MCLYRTEARDLSWEDQETAFSLIVGEGFLCLSTFLAVTIQFHIIHLADIFVHRNLWVESWLINELSASVESWM